MTIEWLAGNRLRGTTAERPASVLAAGSVGGWVELGRTTLGSTGDDIAITGLANKRYYMILNYNLNTYYINTVMRCNADTGNNYALRSSLDGAADTTSQPVGYTLNDSENYQSPNFRVAYASNLSGKEKLLIHNVVTENASGAGTVPRRTEGVGKWSNTSEPIDEFNVFNYGAGSLIAGSEIVVLGWDPADTHTTNFWEELASVTTTSAGNIASGTFTAKKYLMYSIVGKKSTGTGTGSNRLQFNGDTSAKYAQRNSINGTDYDYGGQTSMNIGGDGNVAGELVFYNGFIINNSANEKLLTGHSVFGNTAGAGQIGNRGEIANKWANTSDQITSILCMNCSLDAGAIMKVWGSN